MKRFIYVATFAPIQERKGDPLSFRHAFVMARDEDHAYDLGADLVKPEPQEDLVNDYVVEL